jgi:SP family myo-inositol transporter-like MFS transporter 13
MTSMTSELATTSSANRRYSRFLLLVAGLGGLLYGVDVGIIGGALPYLQATSKLTPSQLSVIVAAVLLGSVISTLFAGMIADWLGRRPLMVISGLSFLLSIPVIALSSGYEALFFGRLLQGVSGGFIGVVVPLYLAECLPASTRGKGTGLFQQMLTLGIAAAALVGIYFSYRVQAVAALGDAAALYTFKDNAWRSIFWVSMPPGALFVIGSLMVSESPRWLFRRNKKDQAYQVLLRSRSEAQAKIELHEMEESANAAITKQSASGSVKESLLKRKYVVPFILACAILSCNTATGVNSVVLYNTGILLQSGLSDLQAHWGYVAFTLVNFLMTTVGMLLVDRKGRRFLLMLGTSGIMISMIIVGTLFLRTEKFSIDAGSQISSLVTTNQDLSVKFDPAEAKSLLAGAQYADGQIDPARASFAVIYRYGDYTCTTSFVRSDDAAARPVTINRDDCVPANAVQSFFSNPFANLASGQTGTLHITKALVGSVPEPSHGWLIAICLYFFMASYAVGPGVCVWLALSELMPARIRSNGMSIALVLNQSVSTGLAGIFLPFVSKFGYSRMFFLFCGFTLIYFLVVSIFLPETKGKTLEEIEAHFEGKSLGTGSSASA